MEPNQNQMIKFPVKLLYVDLNITYQRLVLSTKMNIHEINFASIVKLL